MVGTVTCGGFMAGCMNTSTSATSQMMSEPAPSSMSLSGDWETTCRKQDWFDLSQVMERYIFKGGNTFEQTVRVFKDDCQETQITVKIAGKYDTLGAAKGEPYALNINFTVTSASLTAVSEDAVKMLNTLSYCGVKDWKTDKKIDLVDRGCTGLNYRSGEVIFDIYRRDGDRLYFGRNLFYLARESAADRPANIDERRIFFKNK
jgi:hypothetical protein